MEIKAEDDMMNKKIINPRKAVAYQVSNACPVQCRRQRDCRRNKDEKKWKSHQA